MNEEPGDIGDQGLYGFRIRRLIARRPPPFQGRYQAVLCDREAYLLDLVRYLQGKL